MAFEDSRGDQLGDLRNLVVAGLELVESVEPRLLVGFALLVPRGDARVDVPAEVIEAWLAGVLLDLVFRSLLDVDETDNNISDLYAGVVDVVLDVDLTSAGAQQANEGIAKDGVAEVADVSCFIRVYGGMFNDYFT